MARDAKPRSSETPAPRAAAAPTRLSAWLAVFPLGSFAFVMATGIISVAAHSVEMPVVPTGLLAINLVAYPMMLALILSRLLAYPSALLCDIADHAVGPTSLTMVAATNVLGAQVALLMPYPRVALVLWLFAGLLWVVLLYGFILAVTLTNPKPPIEAGLGGAWLLVTVSTDHSPSWAPRSPTCCRGRRSGSSPASASSCSAECSTPSSSPSSCTAGCSST